MAIFNGFGATDANTTDKGEFVGMMWQLPASVQTQLSNKQLQIVPVNLYGCKEITGKNHVEVFENGDMRVKGVRNVVEARTAADKYIMLSKIRCRTAVVAAADVTGKTLDEIIPNLEWGAPCKVVVNGEWKLAAGATTYMDKTAASVFDHSDQTTIPVGEYKIPGKIIEPQTDLKLDLDLVGEMGDESTKRYFVRFDLIGAETTKA